MSLPIDAVLGWVGARYGNQRDYLVCDNCDREQSNAENRDRCASCGGQIVAVIPNAEMLPLRRITFKMRWLPYRTYELPDGDFNFGPAVWHPPDRGPLRWIMRPKASA